MNNATIPALPVWCSATAEHRGRVRGGVMHAGVSQSAALGHHTHLFVSQEFAARSAHARSRLG